MKNQFILNGEYKLIEHNEKSVLLKIEELKEELSNVIQKDNSKSGLAIEDVFKVITLEEEILKLETESMLLDMDLLKRDGKQV